MLRGAKRVHPSSLPELLQEERDLFSVENYYIERKREKKRAKNLPGERICEGYLLRSDAFVSMNISYFLKCRTRSLQFFDLA